MSITDELREWGGRWENAIAAEVDEIADRIDAAHRSALEKVAAMVDEPDELDRLRERVGAIERKLNHRGDR